MQYAFGLGHLILKLPWCSWCLGSGITIPIQHTPDTVLMQVTMATTNHKAHDVLFNISHCDLPIAIGSASFVIVVTLYLRSCITISI